MSRYFIEVCYKGEGFAGFQVQENAYTIQGAVEEAFRIFFRRQVALTGSSRTDAGVHARQNYFHFDMEEAFDGRWVYNLNSLLPEGVAIRSVRRVREECHCRFDAVWREYTYRVYREKDPFVRDVAYYFPYALDMGLMRSAAELVKGSRHFGAFSKRRTQVKTFVCDVMESDWIDEGGMLVYRVRANRFLRGMVRGLVGTMLQVGRRKIDVVGFGEIIEAGDARRVDFSVPGHGLCLEEVAFGDGYFG